MPERLQLRILVFTSQAMVRDTVAMFRDRGYWADGFSQENFDVFEGKNPHDILDVLVCSPSVAVLGWYTKEPVSVMFTPEWPYGADDPHTLQAHTRYRRRERLVPRSSHQPTNTAI